MFKPEPSITHVPATSEQIVAIVESNNQPQVQIPGKTPQTVFGLLVGVRNPNATFSIFIGLHLPKTGENVVYVHERRQLTVDAYREVEVEGLQFLESMGFMLDNVNFRSLAAAAQEETVRRIPLFWPPRAPAAAPTPPPGTRAAAPDLTHVARLLAAF